MAAALGLLGLGCGAEADAGDSAAPSSMATASLAAELHAAQAGRATRFVDEAALHASLLELSRHIMDDPAVRDSLKQAYPSAFDQIGAEDLYVLAELGEVSVGERILLNAELLVEHRGKGNPETSGAAPSGEYLGSSQQALVLDPLPPATRTINAGLFTITGSSKCLRRFSGNDDLGNLVSCTGTTRINGPSWAPSIRADQLSTRVVTVKDAPGTVEDQGWKSYPCPLVKCAAQRPWVSGEARRSLSGASAVEQSVSDYRKCWGGCFGEASIITFHAVDYGGLSFRFQTSNLPRAVDIDWAGYGHDYEVPWVYNGATCGGAVNGWQACRGTGCAVCKEVVDAFPKYFTNHPKCLRNTTCGGQLYACSANCPAPSDADR